MTSPTVAAVVKRIQAAGAAVTKARDDVSAEAAQLVAARDANRREASGASNAG